MLEFLNSIFTKVTLVVASLLISVGLVTQPVPPTIPQISENNLSAILTETEVVIEDDKYESQNNEFIQNVEIQIKDNNISETGIINNVQSLNNLSENVIQKGPALLEKLKILSIDVKSTLNSVKIEWQTNKPTESKIFLLNDSRVINSLSGLSTRHLAEINNINVGIEYYFEIEAITNNGEFIKEERSFKPTWPENYESQYLLSLITKEGTPYKYPYIESSEGEFIVDILVFKIPNDTIWSSFRAATEKHISDSFMYCNAVDYYWLENKGVNFPYPCPISLQEDENNINYGRPIDKFPWYVVFSREDWLNRPNHVINFTPTTPVVKEVDLYYYRVIGKNTGRVFENIFE